MCGIAGYAGLPLPDAQGRNLLLRMCDTLVHRGPDDFGAWAAAGVGLGMRRLRIIDIDGGAQPMSTPDGRHTLVFNGEIYNYRDLRRGLEERGRAFRTACDTEVLLGCLAEAGSASIHRLNGMFAFAHWDAAERSLLLARDRLGVKPLYYHWDGRSLLFASEIKALLATGLVERSIEPRALWDYLTFRYVPAPHTIWKNIFKLPPAHVLHWTEGSEPRIERYWDIPYPAEAPSEAPERWDEEFGALFRDAVERRLVADVPVGVLLSGGLDSSAVAAVMRERGAALHTFSIGFADAPGANELAYARDAARHLGAEHRDVEIGAAEFIDFLPQFVRFTDEPLADPASVPLHYVSRLAAGPVTVVLSGEGADEILGGYDLDLWVDQWEAERLRVGRLVDLRRLPVPPSMTNYMTSGEKQRLLAGFPEQPDSMDVVRSALDRLGPADTLHQMLFMLSQEWLVEDLLMKADRMSMANSLELRTPFLDYRLVEWAARAPLATKIGPDRIGRRCTKAVLRRFATGRLPDSILTRPKQGFPVPLFDWLAGGSLTGWAHDLLLGSAGRLNGLCDGRELERRVALGTTPDAAVLDRHRVWNLVLLETWMREWGMP